MCIRDSIWIVAITNAVNLIDGLDGLACGVSTISSMTLLVIALVVSEGNVAILMAALAGGCIGFLPYNKMCIRDRPRALSTKPNFFMEPPPSTSTAREPFRFFRFSSALAP